MFLLPVVTYMIIVHTLDGFTVDINPAHITSLHPSSEASPSRGKPNSLVVKGVRCVIGLSNGKFYSVVEDCEEVRKLLEEGK